MDLKNYYQGKTVLITGGVGSIGNYLVREILKYSPRTIRIFDNNESALFDLEQDLASDKIRSFIGDIRDRDRLMMAMEGVDIVFHAAALKHVPLCEFNPFDAVKTNVLGTQNVLDAAFGQEVQKVITISTDKAVNPSNVMGATKLLAERLTISANNYRGKKKTVFSCVRFGNVLNSRGSVIPLFIKQIQKGGPITVTHPDMRRFFMDIPSATHLILSAGRLSCGNEIFILKMPTMNIMDLAEVLRDEFAPRYKVNPDTIPITIVGLRDGEKIDEVLMTSDETTCAFENEEMFLVHPKKRPYGDSPFDQVPGDFQPAKEELFSSKNARLVTKDEIRNHIRNLDL
jgi:FlaA1/EpsC-like NDP-sugar epimerase